MLTARSNRWRGFWRGALAHARWSALVALASLMGCTVSLGAGATPTLAPAVTPADGWRSLGPGLETRLYAPGGAYPFTTLLAVRLDPALMAFRAHYQPGAPLTVDGWRAALPGAVAVVNANFFDAGAQALGLVVADGAAFGTAYRGRGGMVQVVGGQVRVRSTVTEPYNGEPLEQAVQAFPMLIEQGRATFSDARPDRASRRTVAGQDAAGSIVLIVTPSFIGMTLTDLAAYLASSDMGLVSAVNLDGGGSTMLAVNAPGFDPIRVPSVDPVPVVLAAYPR